MKILLISGETCNRCKFIKPFLELYCQKHKWDFEEKDVNDATPEEIEWATMLPVIWVDWQQMDYEKAIEMVAKW